MTIYRALRQMTAACLFAGIGFLAHAQGLRVPGVAPLPVPSASDGSQRSADYIVAVVDSEPITNHQVRQETQRLARQLSQAQQPVPEAGEVARIALERLIVNRSQLHQARAAGVRVEEMAIDDAESAVARQNQVSVPEMHRRLSADGITRSQFRAQLRDQLLVERVREREVRQKVRISELDIDQYLREQQKNIDESTLEINMAQVLVALPDEPSPAQIAAAQVKAQKVIDDARAGADFAALARERSDATDAAGGGELGLRTADRYPALFVGATRDLAVGSLAIVRSGAGIHVLKLLEKRAGGLPATSATQTRASHILLRLSPAAPEAAVRDRLEALRKRLLDDQADFAALARENSQDSSAVQGGDLGWVNPGQLVPEFEDAMNELAPGDVSQPVVSRFGVHLIQVKERRTVALTQREQREAVRSLLRDKKIEEAYVTWAQDLRARAYVEMREPPG